MRGHPGKTDEATRFKEWLHQARTPEQWKEICIRLPEYEAILKRFENDFKAICKKYHTHRAVLVEKRERILAELEEQ